MTIRLTESRLRQIINEEMANRKLQPKRAASTRQPLKENYPGEDEALGEALTEFVEGWMRESRVHDPEAACAALQRAVSVFCEEFVMSYS